MALFVDLVALSNGLHGSVQIDLVALFSWIGWLRHRGILTFPENPDLTKNQSTKNVPDNHPVHYVSQYEPHLTNNSEVLMLLPD